MLKSTGIALFTGVSIVAAVFNPFENGGFALDCATSIDENGNIEETTTIDAASDVSKASFHEAIDRVCSKVAAHSSVNNKDLLIANLSAVSGKIDRYEKEIYDDHILMTKIPIELLFDREYLEDYIYNTYEYENQWSGVGAIK
ncbi:hypothetical protein [Bacillus wiedmannii]|uniref:hypothetical protein n=1 Tax=Bacillus wiedmannii TaxID=1890302 RepID=UPI000BFD25F5|nr:hypothetical protein [Bacillus wiedmannii]PHG78327.1 hypothetical protein COI50_11265 [Bacillus wiedmannii]